MRPIRLAASRSCPCSTAPAPASCRLHTYSPDLGAASPIVNASIVKATQQEKNKGYGQALERAEHAGDRCAQDHVFNATLEKSSKVATAKCKPKKFKWLRTVTYTDNTSETATSAKCKESST